MKEGRRGRDSGRLQEGLRDRDPRERIPVLRQLLGARRGGALLALLAAVVVWTEVATSLPGLGRNADTALAVCVLMPATLAAAWLALPLAGTRRLLPAAVVLLVAAFAFEAANLDGLFNAAKLGAYVLFGFWFLELFEVLSWVVLVALVIPWVDALSVWRGPTKVVVEEHPGVFERIAIVFPLPRGDASASLGPPDVVFLSLFLAAAARFQLRVVATFVVSVALLGLTLVLAVVFDLNGLPALPAVSLGFLLPNADLIWRAVRGRAAAGDAPSPEGPG